MPRPPNVTNVAYAPRGDGIRINWMAISVIIALFAWTASGIWFAATQNAGLKSAQEAIAQLQVDEKENDRQRVEILLHLSSMDQTLKDLLSGARAQVLYQTQPSGNVILQQSPSPSPYGETKPR